MQEELKFHNGELLDAITFCLRSRHACVDFHSCIIDIGIRHPASISVRIFLCKLSFNFSLSSYFPSSLLFPRPGQVTHYALV